jgi:hypothetical protein
VRTREQADLLRDRYLEADVPLARLAEGEFYWHEVVGVSVRTVTGEELGSIADVFRVGGGEVYVLRGGARGEVLVPAVRAVILDFRPRDGVVVVDGGVLGLDEVQPRRPRGRRSSKRLVGEPAASADAGQSLSDASTVASPPGEPAGTDR